MSYPCGFASEASNFFEKLSFFYHDLEKISVFSAKYWNFHSCHIFYQKCKTAQNCKQNPALCARISIRILALPFFFFSPFFSLFFPLFFLFPSFFPFSSFFSSFPLSNRSKKKKFNILCHFSKKYRVLWHIFSCYRLVSSNRIFDLWSFQYSFGMIS